MPLLLREKRLHRRETCRDWWQSLIPSHPSSHHHHRYHHWTKSNENPTLVVEQMFPECGCSLGEAETKIVAIVLVGIGRKLDLLWHNILKLVRLRWH